MEKLLNICKTMLNNANVDIEIEIATSTIILDFIVGASLENVVIRCSNYSYFKIAKSAEDDQAFFVGETNIKLITEPTKIEKLYREKDLYISDRDKKSHVFHVLCEGGVSLEIICLSLAWKINGCDLLVIS